jgi:asparagine synthase (glutamine-hydrolysing)
MCGIVGKVYYDQDHPVEPRTLAAMCQSLVHRGPDDDGFYVRGNVGLGMRRLSIIDLQTGKQPIHNEDRTIWIVCNGEIYNFPELRRELEAKGHRFYTRTDTEAIVHLYEEHGPDFVQCLNGMFAIALWDENRRQLILARDRLGIKPLFYSRLPDRFLFGSEIKAILADNLRPAIDLQALNHYLSVLYIPAPSTIYQEICKLEAGHVLIYQDGKFTIRRYWDLSPIQPLAISRSKIADLQAGLRDLLKEAVRCRLVSDVPLGAFLSGGLDSSTVVGLMRDSHNGPIKTFSIGFNDPSYNELPYARLVAQRFESDHTELTVTPDVADLVPKLVHHFDEPFADSSAVPTYYLSQLTRQHVTVALGGDGGDEVFAGYMTYQADRLARSYGRLPSLLTRRFIPALVHRLPVSDSKVSFDLRARRFVDNAFLEPGRRHYAWKAFFDDDLKRTVLSEEVLASLEGSLDTYPVFQRHYEAVAHHGPLNRFLYTDTKAYLADDILVKVDRMSMAHSLEVRVPLLDHRIVEYMFRLPGHLKMPGLKLKRFLKNTMRDILPRQILTRRKGGFNVPIPAWLKHELRPLVMEYLSPTRIKNQGVFNPETMRRLVSEHMAGVADYSRNIWALLVFNLWYEMHNGQ